MKQQVSEIIDRPFDVQPDSEALGRIARSEEGCKTWRNYHLIGDVIRGEQLSGRCLLTEISATLDSEPTILAPKTMGSEVRGTGQAAGLATGQERSAGRPEVVRSVGVFAIAASLALVAVVTLVPQADRGGPLFPGTSVATVDTGNTTAVEQGADLPAAGQTADSEATSVAVASTDSGGSRSATTPPAADPAMGAFEDEFGQMLVEHGEFTATSGLNGLLAYAKLVSNASLDR